MNERNEAMPGKDAVEFFAGQVMGARYEIIEELGRGGMGAVYRARDKVLGVEVALKTMLPSLTRNPAAVERFYNEARIARQLTHENIIRVHDVGAAGGVLYLSMELVPGTSLRNIMESRMTNRQPFTLKELVYIGLQVCEALHYAHRVTVHRDIKPENIMMLPSGSLKLMDFGISKLFAPSNLTMADMGMGTPFYMAPEQQRDAANVDARADLFSVGVTLYELATWRLPTAGTPASEIRSDIPQGFDGVIRGCLDSVPDNRFQDAAELAAALRGLVKTGEEKPVEVPPEAPRRKRRPAIVGLLVVALLCAAGGLTYYLSATAGQRGKETPQPPIEAPKPVVPAEEPVELPEEADPAVAAREDMLDMKEKTDGKDPKRWSPTHLEDAENLRAEADSSFEAGDYDEAEQTYRRATRAYGMVLAEVSAAEAAPSEMVYIPAGTFTMGDSAGSPDQMHTVHVPGFYIDKYEVTIDDFLRFAGNMSYGVPEVWHQHGLARPGNLMPAFGLSWRDAVNYAHWRSKRLPTEAEWEKAARGPAGLLYPWGNEFDRAKCSVGGSFPADVGSQGEPNAYGCFDMAGNVAEWVSSLYAGYPFNALDGREDPQKLGQRVLRGGAWSSSTPMLDFRTTRRFWGMRDQRFPEAGFRCAQTPSVSLPG